MLEHSLPKPDATLEKGSPMPSATGPAGPIPHPAYCTPQCYAKGKRALSTSCQCRGCRGEAHGRGKKYAFDHGYLKFSLPGSRKPPLDQELLFPEDPLTPLDEAGKPSKPTLIPWFPERWITAKPRRFT
jgi:hypothetical protein